jgi:DNA polymerase I-like protein with 3'-5' exonuclease and polymerase domains
MKKGKVVNCFGRKRRLDVEVAKRLGMAAIGHLKRQAVNAIPQSTASDINCMAAIRIQDEFDRRGMESYVNIMVHDSILAVSPKREVKLAMRIIHKEMTRPVPELHNHSFPADLGCGRSWEKAEKNQCKTLKAALRKVA